VGLKVFSSAFFKNNRQALRAKLPSGSLFVFAGNSYLQRNGDNTYPFRQNSNFWYLTGIDEPDFLLVMDDKREYLVIPDRDKVYEIFNGSLDLKAFSNTSGINEILPASEGWAELTAAIKSRKKLVAFDPENLYVERSGFYLNPAIYQLSQKIKEINKNISFVDPWTFLASLRMVKQPVEIDAIKSALEITENTFTKIKNNLANFKTEKELEAFITYEFNLNSGTHAYSPIVASGKNACTLHYDKNSKPIHKDQLLLIDAGAELNNYASDITRTYSISEPTERQQKVYRAVMEIKDFAFGLLKAGRQLRTYEEEIEKFAGQQLKRLGLIAAEDKESIRKYYPHSTSHFIGLDVHDAGIYNEPLPENVVVSLEPGIYIPNEAIGIRVEDDVLITKDGPENLSEQLSRELY
jgi:Xaa-Pro aminopeptidase